MIAKIKGRLADILKIGKEHGIPIKDNAELIKELYRLELYKPILPELCQAVAVVLL